MADSKSQEDLNNQVEQFRVWLKSLPHLPQNIEDRILKRFLHSCYYDLDKAKSAAELFFTIRASTPELMNDRDPLSPQLQKTLSIVNLAQLRISGNRNLWVWQLNDPGLEKYDYIQDVKLFFLTTDAWLLDDDFLEESDVALLDVKDLSLKFITKFNVSIARKLAKYQEEAIPIRLKEIHIVNAPPFIDKIYGLMKPFLNKDMTNMIHFHTPKSDTLTKYFSKEELPQDYGGTQRKMADSMQDVLKLMTDQRDVLKDSNLWRASKKSKKGDKNDAPKDIESFRSLAID